MPIPSANFPPMNRRRYDQALTERERGMPAQYITGHQEFWGMDFIVTPAVLIPRPETEHVIETVLDLVRVGRAPSPADFLRIVDVGTGSGCIALALAKELPQRRNPRHRYFTRCSGNRPRQRGPPSTRSSNPIP